jgi:hypothetical protein
MKHTTYFNLLDALGDGCPICRLVKEANQKFMNAFLYESVNDPFLRARIRESIGFCNRHAWQLRKMGDPFGQSIIYQDLLRSVLGRLDEVGALSMALKTLARRGSMPKTRGGDCLMCVHEKETGERYASAFARYFTDPDLNRHYRDSFGLCLQHLAIVIRECGDEPITKEIIEVESAKVAHLVGELDEFMRKQDYRFSDEQPGKEQDAWIRAIEKIVGKEGVF